jgi:DNA-binding XRE family transcriptional regulator
MPKRTDEVTVKLKELREQKGYSRKQLADIVGTSPQTIWNIEVHGAEPVIGLAVRLARALGVTVEDLIENGSFST